MAARRRAAGGRERAAEGVDRPGRRLAADELEAQAPLGERLVDGAQVRPALERGELRLVEEAPEHADAVVELRVAIVGLGGGDGKARVHVELVGELESGDPEGLARASLIGLDEAHHGARRRDVVGVGALEAAAVLGVAERHDGERGDAGPGLHPVERGRELGAVVDAGAEHDLGVDLDAAGEQALEHLDSPVGTAADEAAAHLRADRVDGDVHRREAALDDAVRLLVGDVGEHVSLLR